MHGHAIGEQELDQDTAYARSADAAILLTSLESLFDTSGWSVVDPGIRETAKDDIVQALARGQWVEQLVIGLEKLIATSVSDSGDGRLELTLAAEEETPKHRPGHTALDCAAISRKNLSTVHRRSSLAHPARRPVPSHLNTHPVIDVSLEPPAHLCLAPSTWRIQSITA